MARQTLGNNPSVVFRAKKRRQIAILWFGLPFIGVIVWFNQFPQQLNNAVAGTFAIVAISYVAFAVIFSLLNWRCPCCNKWLGKELSPFSCRNCGVGLRR